MSATSNSHSGRAIHSTQLHNIPVKAIIHVTLVFFRYLIFRWIIICICNKTYTHSNHTRYKWQWKLQLIHTAWCNRKAWDVRLLSSTMSNMWIISTGRLVKVYD